ncbi:lysyl-tRNA synthetase [Veillonella parvula]|uniref:lysyl-tRNA synthetase n=1 Tax=Veillonella parvula TaxID=29466 RepID=UPI0028E1BBDB|nr:lysyl-tRNA synthetase [Veillonella parvula]
MQNKALPVRLESPIKVEAEVKATLVGDNGKSAYEIALAHGFVGTEEEWLESLKAKMPNLSGVVSALQGKNILINSGTLEAILTAIVHALDEQPYAPLTFNEPRKGDTEIRVSGQDGFKVRVSGETEAVEIQSGSATIRIQPYGADDIYLEYLNLIDHVIGTVKIKGLIEFNPETATEILPKQFYGRSDLEGLLECPNVVKVGAEAFVGCEYSVVKLPKATDIHPDAFKISEINVLEIPSFIWKDENLNLHDKFGNEYGPNKIIVADESIPPSNISIAKVDLEIYNHDSSKKWDVYRNKWKEA